MHRLGADRLAAVCRDHTPAARWYGRLVDACPHSRCHPNLTFNPALTFTLTSILAPTVAQNQRRPRRGGARLSTVWLAGRGGDVARSCVTDVLPPRAPPPLRQPDWQRGLDGDRRISLCRCTALAQSPRPRQQRDRRHGRVAATLSSIASGACPHPHPHLTLALTVTLTQAHQLSSRSSHHPMVPLLVYQS